MGLGKEVGGELWFVLSRCGLMRLAVWYTLRETGVPVERNTCEFVLCECGSLQRHVSGFVQVCGRPGVQ